jgi:beta-fructofuranosidase
MWECPSFFALDDRHVLVYSPVPTGKVLYFVGDYADGRFTPQHEGQVDWGGDFYAPQVMVDDAGRHIMFGWSWEARNATPERAANWVAQPAVGWAGVHTLPRLLALSPAGELLYEPVPETAGLRGREVTLDAVRLADGKTLALPLAGECVELHAVFAPGSRATLALRCAPDGSEETLLRYNPAAEMLSLDRTRASLDPTALRDVRTAPLALAPDEPLNLRIFLDRSIIEVYANRRCCLTTRIYPTRPDSVDIRLVATDAEVKLQMLRAWRMAAIWPTS